MKEHHMDGTSLVQMLSGLSATAQRVQKTTLRPPNFLTVGATIKYYLEAIAPSVFLLTISWPANQQLRVRSIAGIGPSCCRASVGRMTATVRGRLFIS